MASEDRPRWSLGRQPCLGRLVRDWVFPILAAVGLYEVEPRSVAFVAGFVAAGAAYSLLAAGVTWLPRPFRLRRWRSGIETVLLFATAMIGSELLGFVGALQAVAFALIGALAVPRRALEKT